MNVSKTKKKRKKERRERYRNFMLNCYILRDYLCTHPKATNKQLQQLILTNTGRLRSIRQIKRYIAFMRMDKNFILFNHITTIEKPKHHKHKYFSTRNITVPEHVTTIARKKRALELANLSPEQRKDFLRNEKYQILKETTYTKDKYLSENARQLVDFIMSYRTLDFEGFDKWNTSRCKVVSRTFYNASANREELEYIPETFGYKIQYLTHLTNSKGEPVTIERFWDPLYDRIGHRYVQNELHIPAELGVTECRMNLTKKTYKLFSTNPEVNGKEYPLPENVWAAEMEKYYKAEAEENLNSSRPVTRVAPIPVVKEEPVVRLERPIYPKDRILTPAEDQEFEQRCIAYREQEKHPEIKYMELKAKFYKTEQEKIYQILSKYLDGVNYLFDMLDPGKQKWPYDQQGKVKPPFALSNSGASMYRDKQLFGRWAPEFAKALEFTFGPLSDQPKLKDLQLPEELLDMSSLLRRYYIVTDQTIIDRAIEMTKGFTLAAFKRITQRLLFINSRLDHFELGLIMIRRRQEIKENRNRRREEYKNGKNNSNF